MSLLTKEIKIGDVKIGGKNPLVLIAGPCVIENEDLCIEVASTLKNMTSDLGIPFIFKSSYDKANRSSLKSYRGPGLERGLELLERVKKELGLLVLSDVHRFEDIEWAAEVLDILQIPAFLCRQTDFLIEVARVGKAVNVKKGQFLAPWDVKNVIEKVVSAGNKNVMITERGASFGYNNLVADMRSISIMKQFGYPVVFDATHSVQLPGGKGDSSGGDSSFVPILAKAAVASGCDALFLEVHPRPEKALCDGPTMLRLSELPGLLEQVKKIDAIVRIHER